MATVFPATTLQTCIVHLIRNSLDCASWKERKALAAAIKPIYTAPSAEAAELDVFAQGPWGEKFPTVAAAWRRAWDRVIPFFAFRNGHAMHRPVPGSLFHGQREKLADFRHPRIALAHADLSGFSLFEEAQYRGVLAAERSLGRR